MFKTKNMVTSLISVLAGGMLPQIGSAGEIPSDWKSIKALGMGNAYTAVSNDEMAAFFNPAGITRAHNPRSRSRVQLLSVPGLVIGGNTGGVAALKKSGSILNKITNVFDYAVSHPKEEVNFEGQVYPALIYGGKRSATLLIGMPMRTENHVSVPDPDNLLTAHVQSKTTAGGVFGVGVANKRNTISAGFSLRPNLRYAMLYDEFNPVDVSFSAFKNEIKSKGAKTYAVPVDAGVMFVAADYWMPTLGIAIRNLPTGCVDNYLNPLTGKEAKVCGTKRIGADAGDTNVDNLIDPTELRVGVAITPRFKMSGTAVNFRLSAEANPIPVSIAGSNYGLNEIYVNKLLHVGVEMSFGNPNYGSEFALRAGMNQSFLTYGASIQVFGVAIEYATYAEDIGSKTTQKQDRRHLIGMSARF